MIGSFSLYQLLVPAFACCMIVKAVCRFRRHDLSIRELIVWFVIWTGVSMASTFPDFSMLWFSKITGIKSGFNALIFFTLVALVYGFLHLYVRLEERERTMTELIRNLALKDFARNNMINSSPRLKEHERTMAELVRNPTLKDFERDDSHHLLP